MLSHVIEKGCLVGFSVVVKKHSFVFELFQFGEFAVMIETFPLVRKGPFFSMQFSLQA